MSLLDRIYVRMKVPLQGALFSIGQDAAALGRGDIQSAIESQMGSIPPDSLTVTVTCVTVLCQACDAMRAANNPEAVAALEACIAAVKSGQPPRVIRGSFGIMGESLSEVDAGYEKLRESLRQKLGG